MDKQTTTDVFNDRNLMIIRRSADRPDAMMGAALPVLRPVRIAIARSIDARAVPEPPVSRSVKLSATWRKTEGGRLVCHWTCDLE
jgi:hypothetical protein